MDDVILKFKKSDAKALYDYLMYSGVWDTITENFGKDPKNQPLRSGIGGNETMLYMDLLKQLESQIGE